MTIGSVFDWLQSPEPDYYTGVRLYFRHGKSDTLKNLFDRGENSYTKDKLYSELRSIYEDSRKKRKLEPEPEQPASYVRHTIPKTTRDLNIEALPDELKKMYYNSLIPKLRERSATHAKLELLQQPKRKDAAFRILALSDEIDDMYKQLYYWRDHGHMMPGKVDKNNPQTMTQAQLIQRRYTLRTYVSRTKEDEVKRKKFEKELMEVEKLLQHV